MNEIHILYLMGMAMTGLIGGSIGFTIGKARERVRSDFAMMDQWERDQHEHEAAFNQGVLTMHTMFSRIGHGIAKDQWPKYKDQF